MHWRFNISSCGYVAPPAGAWIETINSLNDIPHGVVAPPAGAWIETSLPRLHSLAMPSRLPQARGLKLALAETSSASLCRASRRRVD